jgi:hypothetical protein
VVGDRALILLLSAVLGTAACYWTPQSYCVLFCIACDSMLHCSMDAAPLQINA